MRAVVQRVSHASVDIAGETAGAIGRGLLVLLGVGKDDTEQDARYLAEKTAGLRVFEDERGKMSRSVEDVSGGVLVVSQFTLFGDVRRGRRPSFDGAAAPGEAERLYLLFCDLLRETDLDVQTGVFRATMDVSLVNQGPVTILLDSKKLF